MLGVLSEPNSPGRRQIAKSRPFYPSCPNPKEKKEKGKKHKTKNKQKNPKKQEKLLTKLTVQKWRLTKIMRSDLVRRKKDILPFATMWMVFEGIMLSEIS